MAEEHETEQGSEELENLSPEELQERIQEEKKNAKRSLRFAFTALIAIIAVCIAWFVANNRVNMTGTQISAENDRPFELASVGKRLSEEQAKLKDENGQNILSAGTEKTYKKYIDINTGSAVENEQTYRIGSSGLAWYMNSEESLVPGAGDELEFYLIPKKSGLTKVEISVDLEGYTLAANATKVSKNTDPKIADLLNGHILFFQYLDATYGYHGWLGADRKITLNAPEQTVDGKTVTEFQKDVPYRVTLRWKWPKYLRNYIYTDRSYGDLFTAAMKSEKAEEYNELIAFVDKQLNSEISTKNNTADNKLFYDEQPGTSSSTLNDKISAANISTTLLDTYSSYYNQADEYIGTNIQYVYIQINVD